jgi:hypothetical protein
MHLTCLNDKIFLFTAQTQKELTLTFFRVQEYYESPHPELNGSKFNTYDFLNRMLDEDGNIDYFSYWSGFNIPGHIVNKWWKEQDVEQATAHELVMFNQLNEQGLDFNKTYYIIGALESDKDTINHEIAHALYYTDVDYNRKMFELNAIFMFEHKNEYLKIRKGLMEMGYSENVIEDEIQAYMSSEKKSFLRKQFGLDLTILKPLVKEYRKVLLKYNTFTK